VRNIELSPQLQNVASEIEVITAPVTLQHRIQQRYRDLVLISREDSPLLWAQTHFDLAYCFLSSQGQKNINRAREHYTKSLELYREKLYRQEEATAQFLLAQAHERLISRGRTQFGEEAIFFYENALCFFSFERAPIIWAFVHAHLGKIYSSNRSDRDSQNLKAALEHFNLALQVYTPEEFPKDYKEISEALLDVTGALQCVIAEESYIELANENERLLIQEKALLFRTFWDNYIRNDPQLSRVPDHLLHELLELIHQAGINELRRWFDELLFPLIPLDILLSRLRNSERSTFLLEEDTDPELAPLREVGPIPAEKIVQISVAYYHTAAQRDHTPNYADIEVFYATDREPTGDKKPSNFYSNGRDPSLFNPSLSLGVCQVSIPRDHNLACLEEPSIWSLEFKQNPSKYVVLLAVTPQLESEFFTSLQNRITLSKRKEAFVFIHGYNSTFEDAVRRTAQLAYDLRFDGAPIAYTWPSFGDHKMYVADEATIESTIPLLTEFLEQVIRSVGAEVIHLIGHSMGNRALTGALQSLLQHTREASKAKVQQVILAAPDIDAQVFKQLAGQIRLGCERITLYASSKDVALSASKVWHTYPRAGEAGPNIVVIPEVETIDASAVKTDLLGHSYYANNTSILSDIFYLIHSGTPPSDRFGLIPVYYSQANCYYWRFGKRPEMEV
jgi:esterase/lipase superfamily enzyme/tetratricopeptide (TPR) repeat protein